MRSSVIARSEPSGRMFQYGILPVNAPCRSRRRAADGTKMAAKQDDRWSYRHRSRLEPFDQYAADQATETGNWTNERRVHSGIGTLSCTHGTASSTGIC